MDINKLTTHQMLLMILAERLGLIQVTKDSWEGKYGSPFICTPFGFILDTADNRKKYVREIIEIPL